MYIMYTLLDEYILLTHLYITMFIQTILGNTQF